MKIGLVKGATLIEAIVSLVIIFILISIIGGIIVGTARVGLDQKRMKALQIIQAIVYKDERERQFQIGEQKVNEFSLIREVIFENDFYLNIHYSVFEINGKKIYEVNALFRK